MIIYIDMDDVLCDYTSAFNEHLKQTPEIKFPQSQYGFYEKLEPINGAISCLKEMSASKTIEPYILTAPSERNPFSYTEKRVWVEKHLGYRFVEKLIICSNKGLLKGDYLIDDNINGKGQEAFAGELIHFGSHTFPDWLAVRKYFKELTNL